jgi:hypothetical protein
MEKRSRRRTRDLVTQAASQGLSENEIGCARISIMAKSTNAPCKGRIQMRKTTPSICSHPACNARPVHTNGSKGEILVASRCFPLFSQQQTFGASVEANAVGDGVGDDEPDTDKGLAAQCGLNSNIAPCPKSAMRRDITLLCPWVDRVA